MRYKNINFITRNAAELCAILILCAIVVPSLFVTITEWHTIVKYFQYSLQTKNENLEGIQFFIMFCLSAVLFVIIIFLLRSKKILFRKELTTVEEKDRIEKKKNSLGEINYTDKGFTSYSETKSVSLKWDNIEKIALVLNGSYELGRFVILVHFVSGFTFEIDEDTDGWNQFKINLEKFVPLKNDIDTYTILMVAKSTDTMIIYDRDDKEKIMYS